MAEEGLKELYIDELKDLYSRRESAIEGSAKNGQSRNV